MSSRAQFLSDSYSQFLATCSIRPNPYEDESCRLFEAWLEVHGIPTQDFSDTDWFEFLALQGVTDPDEQFDFLERIAEWGGIIVRARQNAAIGRV